MELGNTVIIGFTADQFAQVEDALGIQISLDENEIHGTESINQTLRKLHLKLIEDMSFQLINDDLLFTVATPKGERHIYPFSFELHYDSYYMDDEKEDACVGVSLTSRYCPILIDWEFEKGKSNPVTALKKEDLLLIEKVQNELIALFPIFNKSSLIVKVFNFDRA